MIFEEELRLKISQRFRVDTSQRQPPAETFPPPPLRGTPSIQPLTSAEAMREEGRVMAHCLVSPAREEAVRRLEGYAYRITRPCRATAWVVPADGLFRLEELRSYKNRRVSRVLKSRVESWLEDALAKGVAKEWESARSPWVEFERVPDELTWATGACPF